MSGFPQWRQWFSLYTVGIGVVMLSRRQKDFTVPTGMLSTWAIFLYPIPVPRMSLMDCFQLSVM
jgi:hypothetical protein